MFTVGILYFHKWSILKKQNIKSLEPVLWIGAGYANLPQLFWLAIKRHVCGFYEATQRLSCNCTSAELTQFDGRAGGDDVMENLTVSLLRASQVTVGMLAYRCCADS